MTTGEKIKGIRSELGIGQKLFAETIGATVSALSNWENDRNKPNDIMIRRIAKLGDTTVSYLLNADNTKDQRLKQILDLTYNLIFTSVNLTDKQKEMLAEIRELSEEE